MDEIVLEIYEQDQPMWLKFRAGDLDFARREVDWMRPAAELQRWLRAMIFPPMQHPVTQRKGEPLEIHRVGAVGPAVEAPPGCVVEVSEAGAWVACGEGSLLLREPADALRVGDRLE